MTASVECPVNGGPCKNALCTSAPGCASEADRILYLDIDEMEEAINTAADRLKLDRGLFADFVYERAFGAGSSMNLNTEGDTPFADI